jgi:cupin fold WbuC family metalloprotein
VIFDDSGEISQVIDLEPYGGQAPFYYRLEAELFHTVLLKSKDVVLHETTSGPFIPRDALFPTWAPSEDEPDAAQRYLSSLAQRVRDFRARDS